MRVHAFLKDHGVALQYTKDDLEHDLREAHRVVGQSLNIGRRPR